MKVAAYRIFVPKFPAHQKLELLDVLNRKILKRDSIWHFFLDPDSITLRCQRESVPKVDKFFQDIIRRFSNGNIFKVERVKDFDPSIHEYMHIRHVGDDLQHIFHATSLLALKYPAHILVNEILERTSHIIVNQAGIHDFRWEANYYINEAYRRVALQGRFLGLPKWVHKFFIRLFV